jgi:hypothetical protein
LLCPGSPWLFADRVVAARRLAACSRTAQRRAAARVGLPDGSGEVRCCPPKAVRAYAAERFAAHFLDAAEHAGNRDQHIWAGPLWVIQPIEQ